MLPSGLPALIGEEESLVRFLTSKGQYSSMKKMVKPAAFMPSPISHDTSIMRHDREPVADLIAAGNQVVTPSGRNLHGAAFFILGAVRQARLQANVKEPPPRHAVIVGWAQDNDPKTAEAAQLEQAAILASAAGQPVLFQRH